MDPFEELIHQLSLLMTVELHLDAHQSCLIHFVKEDIQIQIDLDSDAENILVGIQLERITPGPYRERIFLQALKFNALSQIPQGILAFSEKNDTLILYQFLPLQKLNGEKLHAFLERFRIHAQQWKEALKNGEIPPVQENITIKDQGIFGLNK